VSLQDTRGRGATGKHAVDDGLHVRGPQARELHAADARHDVDVDEPGVASVCGGPYPRPCVRQPVSVRYFPTVVFPVGTALPVSISRSSNVNARSASRLVPRHVRVSLIRRPVSSKPPDA